LTALSVPSSNCPPARIEARREIAEQDRPLDLVEGGDRLPRADLAGIHRVVAELLLRQGAVLAALKKAAMSLMLA
jgi:hypothetical protein